MVGLGGVRVLGCLASGGCELVNSGQGFWGANPGRTRLAVCISGGRRWPPGQSAEAPDSAASGCSCSSQRDQTAKHTYEAPRLGCSKIRAPDAFRTPDWVVNVWGGTHRTHNCLGFGSMSPTASRAVPDACSIENACPIYLRSVRTLKKKVGNMTKYYTLFVHIWDAMGTSPRQSSPPRSYCLCEDAELHSFGQEIAPKIAQSRSSHHKAMACSVDSVIAHSSR